MVIQQIGETAGRIWHTLDEKGELRVSILKRQVDVPEPILYMALGWLAREDKLAVEPRGRTFVVRLK
ncbi:MAG: winged helix-turn-helix domain-containing protein [Firmicutes bacterium]|nr:winged helix-turn-helix domain-containing protein [Bacillota bacterium]